ncbi:MAG: hypothetical protein LBD53_10945 [Tannerella sp.]|jgi:hypothetical protein|nr:hypothetical protein [Tannerella sp.]
MTEEKNTLDELLSRNPFRVPERYFEEFTANMMSRLPEQAGEQPTAKVIPLLARIKPLLYLAAAFTGVVILFNVFNGIATLNKTTDTMPEAIVRTSVVGEADDNEEFFDYLKDLYSEDCTVSYINDYVYN